MADPYSKVSNQTFTSSITYSFGVPSTTTVHRIWANVLSGYGNPKYRDQIRQHKPASTDATGSHIEVTNSVQGSVDHFFPAVPGWQAKYWTASGLLSWIDNVDYALPGLPSATLRNLALARFYNDCSRCSTTLQAGVIFGELKETLHMLKHPLDGMRSLMQRHGSRPSSAMNRKKGGRKSKREIARDVGSSWLEFAFGWIPLSYDISDIVSLLESRGASMAVDYAPVKGVARSQSGSVAYAPGASGHSAMWATEYHTIDDAVVRFKGQYRLTVSDGSGFPASSFAEQAGLTIGHFIPTVYELLPWSFLVDYFTNVGDVLNAFSVPSSRIAWVNETQRSLRTRRRLTWLGRVWGTQRYVTGPYTAVLRLLNWSRTGSNGGGVSFPGFALEQDWFTPHRAANLCALYATGGRSGRS